MAGSPVAWQAFTRGHSSRASERGEEYIYGFAYCLQCRRTNEITAINTGLPLVVPINVFLSAVLTLTV